MWQHIIFLQIFSACRMYAFPSSLMIIFLLARSSLEYKPVCVLKSRSSKQCLTMFALRLLMYDLLHSGTWLLSRRPTGCTILNGSIPINDLSGKLRMNAWWLPTSYPNGITHALLLLRSLDIHIPLIGFKPQKNVAPGILPMYWTIASRRSNPFLSPSSFPSGQLVVFIVVHKYDYPVPWSLPLFDLPD
jgi:hypothetical protein